MGLFQKQKPETGGRHRPVQDSPSARPSQAFSYYSRGKLSGENTGRGQAPPPERIDMRAPSRRILENRIAVTLASIAGLGLVLYLLALGGAPKIETLTSSGSTYFLEDTQAYQQTAHSTIAGSIINSNKLTFDTNSVSRAITKAHPEIESVTVGMPFFGRSPIIYIKPYTPSFILTTTDSKAFLLDVNGRALVSASQIGDTGELDVPTLQDNSGTEVTLGSQALPASIVSFTEAVSRVLEEKGVGYSSLVLPPASSELDVFIAGTPYHVKFNLQGEVMQQIGTFLATRQRLSRDKVMPGEYIDVRVPERAYYR